MGMSADEYWYGDPSLIYAYAKAFENKRKTEIQMAWVIGGYVRNALMSTPVLMGMGKPIDYPEMPYEHDFEPKREISPEKKELMEKFKAKAMSMGLKYKD